MTYVASPIKRRRSTRAEVEARRETLLTIVEEQKPMTVRQVYYQATVRGLVPKTEAGYGMVQVDLTIMRKSGVLPYWWLTDSTRLQRKPISHSSIEAALRDTADCYRKDLWRGAPVYVEMWCEKDALSGVLFPITSRYDVPLMCARGYSSLSFLYGAAENIIAIKKPAYIYHLGDFDPSGVNAGENIEQTLRKMAPDAEIHFERLAVSPAQISEWNLPTRPTKTSDTRSKGFGDISVELDSITPDNLRAIVENAITRHLPPERLSVLEAAEQSERSLLHMFATEVGGRTDTLQLKCRDLTDQLALATGHPAKFLRDYYSEHVGIADHEMTRDQLEQKCKWLMQCLAA